MNRSLGDKSPTKNLFFKGKPENKSDIKGKNNA